MIDDKSKYVPVAGPYGRVSESVTRAKLIDPLLTAAGWNLKDRTQVDFEIPVDGYDKEPWNGITDYCLFHPSGEVLAIVEAKKTSRHARDGQEQLRPGREVTTLTLLLLTGGIAVRLASIACASAALTWLTRSS